MAAKTKTPLKKASGPKLEIEQTLVLSTAHLRESIATGDGDEPRMDSVASYTGEYGWLVWAGMDPDDGEDGHDAMQELRNLLNFAMLNGCKYVRFDRDADTIEGFPTYEW